MLTDTVPEGPGLPAYGYGLNIWDRDPFYHERQINHLGSNPGVVAEWEYYPDSQRLIFVALNRTDMVLPPDLEPVDATKVLASILYGVRDILQGAGVQPAVNLLLGD